MPSFCRQLNNHGFTARNQDVYGRGSHRYCFGHPNFVRSKKGLLKEIALIRKPQPVKAARKESKIEKQVKDKQKDRKVVRKAHTSTKSRVKRQSQAHDEDIYGRKYTNRSQRSSGAESENNQMKEEHQEQRLHAQRSRRHAAVKNARDHPRTPSPEPFHEPIDLPEPVYVEMGREQKAASLFLHMVHSAQARASVLTNTTPAWISADGKSMPIGSSVGNNYSF
jgi:hypothetical protein